MLDPISVGFFFSRTQRANVGMRIGSELGKIVVHLGKTHNLHSHRTFLVVLCFKNHKPINDRVDEASATETVDSDSILNRIKPKSKTINIYNCSA